jgi:hypothetical protein
MKEEKKKKKYMVTYNLMKFEFAWVKSGTNRCQDPGNFTCEK